MIASINQTFLSRDPRFSLAAVFHSGQEALEWLRKRPVELLILDVYMPRMSGLELLRELRAEEITLDVIMVTAANDSKTVDALLKLGVADYLVKPFTARRFQQALDTFCRQREAISAHTSVSQEDLDAMLSSGRSAAPVPKGLQLRTLARVRECLAQAPREGCTCEALSEQVGLSSVTVRRYLTYLVGRGEAVSRINYDTGGRPSLLYRLSQSWHLKLQLAVKPPVPPAAGRAALRCASPTDIENLPGRAIGDRRAFPGKEPPGFHGRFLQIPSNFLKKLGSFSQS